MNDYVPIKLAYDVAEPMFGRDENLCPIIFIHGFNQSKELWHQIPYEIANETHRRAYAYDIRNHGDSQWSNTFNCDLMLKDLQHFMNSNKIQKAIIIAHSLSAYVALKFAITSPERVEMVIAADPLIGIETKEERDASVPYGLLWAEAIRKVPPFTTKDMAIKLAVDYMYDQIPPEKQETLSDKEHLYQCNYILNHKDDGSYDVKLNVEVVIESFKTDVRLYPLEGVYEGPAYFINGSKSYFKVYEKKEEILKHFPKAELFLINGASHHVHIDATEEFIQLLFKILVKN
uniref:sn-1-specific diacylglycerol lipase ABHD11 n=1 Tax=Parasteatoda tepidariorum TaxID=114398 RepID=A0A2L2Y8D1_PARTP